jgi:NAD(P)-dependent dehydrogenase (short-subunit alcohol dehydrogenase family)
MAQATSTLQGKVCLITGATSGIGAVAAHELARQGATVTIVGRDPHKCQTTVSKIQSETGNPAVTALRADLSSQEEIRQLARQVRERYPHLDVLINNAGGVWMKRQTTVDGLEMTWAVNHLAYFLLTHLLLDLLQASASARIINVSSRAHQRANLNFDDLQGQQYYSGWKAYCRSKLANLLFTYELARRLEGTTVTANALHPGFVATGFGGNNGWLGRLYQALVRWVALTPEQGAQDLVYLASAPEVAMITGKYFVQKRAVASSAASYDQDAARRLWQVSLEQTGLTASTSATSAARPAARPQRTQPEGR